MSETFLSYEQKHKENANVSVCIEDNAVVLFQGDSITEACRNRMDASSLGSGYAMIAAGMFSALHPEKNVRFCNRGISGNRLIDLRARWQEDCLDLKPTWLSVLIGVNDTLWRFRGESISADNFESMYREILTTAAETCQARLILCEPFLLSNLVDHDAWREDLEPKIQVVRKLAREFKAIHVPFDDLFAAAMKRRESSFWALDGVHPTGAGHALMARAWLQAVGAI